MHQIIGEFPAKSLEEFVEVLQDNTFLIVREIYRDAESGQYYPVGDVAINPQWVGKIKIFN